MVLRKKKQCEWMGDNLVCQTIRRQMNTYKECEVNSQSPWIHITREPGILVWRVNNNQLELIPNEDYGTFYNGDSYLVLHTHGDPLVQLYFDIYMWIGSQSTCGEYGFAAFKMTELHHKVLKDGVTQHRESHNYESNEFQALFPSIKILKGGYGSSLKTTIEPERNPRLFHISGVKKNVKCAEISYRFENLNSEDVFIIDNGKMYFQFNGKNANKDARIKAAQALEELRSRRKGIQIEIIDELDDGMNHPAVQAMPKKNTCTLKKNRGRQKERFILLRVSDSSGAIKMEKVKESKASLKDFDPIDAFVYDTSETCYVWSGSKISFVERVMAVPLAEIYLHNSSQKGKILNIITEGEEPKEFLALLAA